MNLTSSAAPNVLIDSQPTFSGHETFVLRSTWLKKAYDLLLTTPELFSRDDAFVQLGVGKNMAHAIRYWGRVCAVFERNGTNTVPTAIGQKLFADNGWDPFLVTSTSWWLLHWKIVARPEAAFTWFYTFNLLRGGEFTVSELVTQLRSFARERAWRIPSEATMTRDVECMVQCYRRTSGNARTMQAEDTFLCPFNALELLQPVSELRSYRLMSGAHPSLPDELVAYAIHDMVVRSDRRTIAFNDLAYMPRSPGRVFRLDEDALLNRLQRLNDVTDRLVYYQDQAGIRQIAWDGAIGEDIALKLLEQAFQAEIIA